MSKKDLLKKKKKKKSKKEIYMLFWVTSEREFAVLYSNSEPFFFSLFVSI